jgi:hypothetical protein
MFRVLEFYATNIKESIQMYWEYVALPYSVFLALCLTMIDGNISTSIVSVLPIERSISIITITEELTRTLSFIAMPYPIVYTIFLSIWEFFSYIYKYPTLVSPEYVTMRFICIGLHFACYGIQLLGFKKYKETGDWVFIPTFSLLAVLFHIIFNMHLNKILIAIIY